MENFGDVVGIVDYMRLMQSFLDGRMDAQNYAKSYFDLTKRRTIISDDEVSRITQQAYGDADDYEPDLDLRRSNPQWIDEPELRQRVAKSFRELEALGYRIER